MKSKEILKMSESKSSGVFQIKISVDGEDEYIVVHGCCLPHVTARVMQFLGYVYDEEEVEFLGINVVEGEYVDLDDELKELEEGEEGEGEDNNKGGGSINTRGGDEKPGYWSGGKGSGYLN
jgi:hypothetical protein